MTDFSPAQSAKSALQRWAQFIVAPERSNEVFQTSTMAALLDGVYDGEVTIADLLRHGDFGIGTFNGLDGEMLVLDGVCHQLRADGTAKVAAPDQLAPFAVIARFSADHRMDVSSRDRADVTNLIDRSLESLNLIVALRVTGYFGMVRTRTVTRQHKPYRAFTQATQE